MNKIIIKIMIPVASAILIAVGGAVIHYWGNINVLPDKVKALEHKIDSLNFLYQTWIANLDKEVAVLQEK